LPDGVWGESIHEFVFLIRTRPAPGGRGGSADGEQSWGTGRFRRGHVPPPCRPFLSSISGALQRQTVLYRACPAAGPAGPAAYRTYCLPAALTHNIQYPPADQHSAWRSAAHNNTAGPAHLRDPVCFASLQQKSNVRDSLCSGLQPSPHVFEPLFVPPANM